MREIPQRLTISLLVLATILGIARPISAQIGPHVFDMGNAGISVAAGDGAAQFGGNVERVLNVSDATDDEYTLTVTGRLYLFDAGCAAVRVEYLDLNGNVVDEDQSKNLAKPDKGPAVLDLNVVEADRGPSNLDVRVVLKYGPSCDNMNESGERESNLPYAPPNVGTGGVVITESGTEQLSQFLATIDLGHLLGVTTNPVGQTDLGYGMAWANITWHDTPQGCIQLEVIAFAAGRQEIGRQRLEMSCGRDTPVLGTAVFESAELDRLVVRRHYYELDGETEVYSHTVAHYHLLD